MSSAQEITISLTMQDWQVCRAGLLELPGKIGLPVLMKLEPQLVQAQRQLQKTNGEDRETAEASS